MILNKAKYCYENSKQRLREQAKDKYRNVCDKYKNKKREYVRSRYHNMSGENKNKTKTKRISKKLT